jgi:hypothetical protein
MDLRLRFPPGIFMVQAHHRRMSRVNGKCATFREGPVQGRLAGGSMYLLFQRVTDAYAPAAFRGISIQIAP